MTYLTILLVLCQPGTNVSNLIEELHCFRSLPSNLALKKKVLQLLMTIFIISHHPLTGHSSVLPEIVLRDVKLWNFTSEFGRSQETARAVALKPKLGQWHKQG